MKIDNSLPPEIALNELRLNIKEQYGETVAFFCVDMAVMGLIMEMLTNDLHKLKIFAQNKPIVQERTNFLCKGQKNIRIIDGK